MLESQLRPTSRLARTLAGCATCRSSRSNRWLSVIREGRSSLPMAAWARQEPYPLMFHASFPACWSAHLQPPGLSAVSWIPTSLQTFIGSPTPEVFTCSPLVQALFHRLVIGALTGALPGRKEHGCCALAMVMCLLILLGLRVRATTSWMVGNCMQRRRLDRRRLCNLTRCGI